MPLAPPSGRRERILVCGFSGTGKSTTWLDLAEWLWKTKSQNKVFLVDNDHAWEGARPEDGHLDEVVVVWDVQGFQEHRAGVRAAVKQIEGRGEIGKNDWLVLDMADKLWNIAQNDYWVMAYGKEIDEIFLDSKINNFNMAGDYGSNWGVINKMYDAMFGPIVRARCHVLCVTSGEEVKQSSKPGADKVNDSPEIIKMFGKFKVKPAGQKRLPYEFHTILLTQNPPSGYTLTTLKDRNPAGVVARAYVVNQEMKGVNGFVMTYLVKVARWKIGG